MQIVSQSLFCEKNSENMVQSQFVLKSIRTQVNSFSFWSTYSFFGQFVLIEFFFGQFVLIWSIRTHFGQLVLILVNSFSH